MKAHYFHQEKPDEDDIKLKLVIQQGYVPKTCLLSGRLVWHLVMDGEDPCKGCEGPRERCLGRSKI